MSESKHTIYPHIEVKNNLHPNRLYSFPLLGIAIKGIMLIPVFIEGFFLGLAFLFYWIANSFVILFTGKYWDASYEFFIGIIKFGTKINLFILGLTDKYPGFNLETNGTFELRIDKPTIPNRWLAFPLLGILVRFILLIPYLIFARVMQNGSNVAMVASWFIVTVKGKYPESLYEFERDGIRVGLGVTCYLTCLSDRYPSFHISMTHQTVKILLLIAGTLIFLFSRNVNPRSSRYNYQYQKQFNKNNNMYFPPTTTQ